MKKVSFNIKKWAVRLMVAIGAMLGLSACSSSGSSSSTSSVVHVYGPPPDVEKEIEQVEDVYGPPVEDIREEIEPVEVVYGPAPVEGDDTTQKAELKDFKKPVE